METQIYNGQILRTRYNHKTTKSTSQREKYKQLNKKIIGKVILDT